MGPDFPSGRANRENNNTAPQAAKGPRGSLPHQAPQGDPACCRDTPKAPHGPEPLSLNTATTTALPPSRRSRRPGEAPRRIQANARPGNSANSTPNLGRRVASPRKGRRGSKGQSDCLLKTQLRERGLPITRGDFSPVRIGHPSEERGNPA